MREREKDRQCKTDTKTEVDRIHLLLNSNRGDTLKIDRSKDEISKQRERE